MIFLSGPAKAKQIQNRVALVIANSSYRFTAQLPNPVADGKLIAASLKGAGFQSVQLLENQDRAGMEQALRAFASKVEQADVVMLYYAGHGIEYNGENYLIPVDAKLQFERDLEIEAIKLSTMVSLSEGAKRLRIIVLDACRTPPPGLKKATASRSLGRGLAPVEPEGDSLVVYSAKAGTTAADGDDGNSPFAKAMARRILQPGREISLLFRDIRDDVLKATGRVQEPFTYGSLSSQEFYFIDPPIRTGSAGTVDLESELWGLCRDSSNGLPCKDYLKQYPRGRFLALAQTRISDLSVVVAPRPSAPTPAPVSAKLQMIAQLGVQVQPSADGSSLDIRSVAKTGPSFGQLFVGDVIVGINSESVKRDVTAADQLNQAIEIGKVKLLVKRGASNVVVIVRKQ